MYRGTHDIDFFPDDPITDDHLTLMGNADKVTDNRNQL